VRPHPTALVLLALFAGGRLAAQQQTPYAGLRDRDVKALSPEDTRALLEGEGMGMALAAELNGYPGPRHVLELGDSLHLDARQVADVQAVFDRMQAEARQLGTEIISEETALDRAFAAGTITPTELAQRTARLGDLRGRLRRVHLAAHLDTRALLTASQVSWYQELRGYGTGAADHHGHRPPR